MSRAVRAAMVAASVGNVKACLSLDEGSGAGWTSAPVADVRNVLDELERLQEVEERYKAVEDVLKDAERHDLQILTEGLRDALEGAPATEEEERLWRFYFDNAHNAKSGWDGPKDGFRRKKTLALRCNRCAYLVGGFIHAHWHEGKSREVSESMMEERARIFAEKGIDA